MSAARERIAQFLDEMNIPRKLGDDMMLIAPENMKILKMEEIQEYKMIGDDIDYVEAMEIQDAYKYQLKRDIYYSIKKWAEWACYLAYPGIEEENYSRDHKLRVECIDRSLRGEKLDLKSTVRDVPIPTPPTPTGR